MTDLFISCVYSIDRGCKDDCDLITLGSYKTVDNYELNGAKDTVSHLILRCDNLGAYRSLLTC